MTIALYSCFHPNRKCIYAGNSNAVQTAGNFIRTFIKFSTSMKTSKNKFQSRNMFSRVNINRNSASIVFYANYIIFFKSNNNFIAITSHCFINRIVNGFINKMMKSFWTCRTYVHSRTFSYSFKSF